MFVRPETGHAHSGQRLSRPTPSVTTSTSRRRRELLKPHIRHQCDDEPARAMVGAPRTRSASWTSKREATIVKVGRLKPQPLNAFSFADTQPPSGPWGLPWSSYRRDGNPVDLQTFVAPVVVVVMPEEIDIGNAAAMRELLNSACSPGVTVVIADLTSSAFCDMSGWRNLLSAHEYAGARGAQLRLVIRPGGLRRVLKLLGFDCQLSVYPDLESASTGGCAV